MFSSQYGAQVPEVPVDSGREEVLVPFGLIGYGAVGLM